MPEKMKQQNYMPKYAQKDGFMDGFPKVSKLPIEVQAEDVYTPAEDTLLLLRAALEEARPDDRAIEIGCGSALISQELAPRVKSLICTDINPHAVQAAKRNGMEALRADLFAGLSADFDLIIFNPPYLPTTDEERSGGWIDRALDGGESGRETIDRFLEDLSDHFSPEGRAMLLISSLTGLTEVKEKARAVGLCAQEAAGCRCFFEQLHVLKLTPARRP